MEIVTLRAQPTRCSIPQIRIAITSIHIALRRPERPGMHRHIASARPHVKPRRTITINNNRRSRAISERSETLQNIAETQDHIIVAGPDAVMAPNIIAIVLDNIRRGANERAIPMGFAAGNLGGGT